MLWKGILDGWHCRKFLCLDISPSESSHHLLVLPMKAVGALMLHPIFSYVSQTSPVRFFFFFLLILAKWNTCHGNSYSDLFIKVLLPLLILFSFFFFLIIYFNCRLLIFWGGICFSLWWILASGIWIPWILGVILLLSLVLLHLFVFWDVRL